jgi:hypothetical protein
MSSPLDARMRLIAREEAAALAGPAPAVQESGADRLAHLEREVADLRSALERAVGRLDAIEQASTDPKPATRRARKTAEPTE